MSEQIVCPVCGATEIFVEELQGYISGLTYECIYCDTNWYFKPNSITRDIKIKYILKDQSSPTLIT